MFQLHEDVNFHFETMRAIGNAPYQGADITEILEIMPKIKAGDFESWYDEWYNLALRVLSTIDETKEDSYSPVTLRAVYYRASHYFFVADFFLHGNKSDPRLGECFNAWTKYFDKANALLPIPGKRTVVKADGFEMPVMIFRAAQASTSNPRPTLIVGGGFESVMQETMHVFGFAALERGYNLVLYEGPGHRTLVHEQGQGFIAEWEKAVTPVVDFLFANKQTELSFIDTDKLGLVGMSLGGVLAARAAAFEPRLAALMCIDGVYDFMECIMNILPQAKSAWEAGDRKEFDAVIAGSNSSTNERWLQDNLRFTFCNDSIFEIYGIIKKMTLANGVAERIRMPAFLGDATDDLFFQGQAPHAAEAIGSNATLQTFGPEQGAHLHCQCGAEIYMNQEMMEWFATVVGH